MNSVFDALSHPIRREVLQLLKSGGMSAGENKGGTITYTLNMSTLEEAVMGFMGRMGVTAQNEGDVTPEGESA
jgi:hypothetical protein